MSNDILNADVLIESLTARTLTGSHAARLRRGRRGAAVERASRAALMRALDLVTDAVYFISAKLKIIDCNVSATHSTGYSSAELRSMSWIDLTADDGRLRNRVDALLRGEAPSVTQRVELCGKGGARLPVQVKIQRVEQLGQVVLVALVRHDDDRGSKPATRDDGRDYLTGLPDRAALDAQLRLAESQARQDGQPFAVLFVDVDDFKRVNDTHGHRAGDVLLLATARRLLASVRPGDFVARYGGDEFVAVIQNVRGEDEVRRIAKRIRAALRARVTVAGSHLKVSASVGVAIGNEFSSADDLLDEADRAMYRAKRKPEDTR